MKSSVSKTTGQVKNTKTGKTIRKKKRSTFSEDNFDIDYVSTLIDSMDYPDRQSGMLDDLFEELNDWE